MVGRGGWGGRGASGGFQLEKREDVPIGCMDLLWERKRWCLQVLTSEQLQRGERACI